MKITLLNEPSQADYVEVVELLNEVFSEFPGNKEYSAKVAQKRMENSNDSVVVKVLNNNGDIVAFAICYQRYKNYYHIWQLGVKSRYRKKGIASKIYDSVEEYAKSKMYKGVTLNTFEKFGANIGLIKKRGYKLYKKDFGSDSLKKPKLMYKLDFN